jgi:HAMP domain-containing protein
MRKISFQVKLNITFIALVTGILAATTLFTYQSMGLRQKEQLRLRILNLSKLASMLIDGDKHAQIPPELASQNTPAYKEIREVLKKIKSASPLVESVYTMAKTNKEDMWMFIADSGDNKGDIAYCGERYDVSKMPEMRLAFDNPIVDKELSADKWGVWLSGYAPVYNRAGEKVAIVGLDVSAKSIRQMDLLLAKKLLLMLIFVIIVSLFMGWLISRGIARPVRELMRGVREVGKGNLAEKINVESRDEFQELAGAFNKMTDSLLESQAKLQRHYLSTVKALAQALEAKDPYTKGHSDRVTAYAVAIAKKLGLTKGEVKLIEELSILHDIGKIGIPEGVLTKQGALTDEEWRIIKEHPAIGEEILKPIEFLRPGLSIVLDHHERADGKGYPRALKKNEISILASIVSVADAYDAMTSDRPYRKALPKEKAIAILRDNTDSQFNGRVVEAFIESLK